MNKYILFASLLMFMNLSFASAACTLTPTLINQDPINAVPGELVKVVFQLDGVQDPLCALATVEFVPQYPFILEPGYSSITSITAGTYVKDFNSFLMIPYKIRVDSSAIDGDYPLKIKITGGISSPYVEVRDFNVSIKDVQTDFILTIDSYSFATKKLVLGLVNIGDADAKAVTVELPPQDHAAISGGHVKLVGSLDTTEDTTLTFDGDLTEGNIKAIISYNDKNGFRREVTKEVLFTEGSFAGTKVQSNTTSPTLIIGIILAVGIIVFWLISRNRSKKRNERISR